MAIFAPALARPSAIARPIPLFPPVTIATLPFSDVALLLSHGTERTRYPRPLVQSDDASKSYHRAPAIRLHEAPAVLRELRKKPRPLRRAKPSATILRT